MSTFSNSSDDTYSYQLEPIPGVRLTKALQFVGSNTLTPGGCNEDELLVDKTTREWRRWVYYKSKKKIPELSTNAYGNKLLIEKLERASIAMAEKHYNVADEYFRLAMDETTKQFINPRSDSAEALDRLGAICYQEHEITKAITCFEYSLHMRKILYGKDGIHLKIVQSLVYLGSAWAEYGNFHRAIIVFEKARDVAKSLPHSENDHQWTVQRAEIYHNLGTCWERLHEHHSALDCYAKAEKLRRLAVTPDVSLRRRAREKNKLKL